MAYAEPPFLLVQAFGGYRNKTDITNIPEEIKDKRGNSVLTGYLVSGSQNVIITDADRVMVRNGYTLDGAAASNPNTSDPIVSSADFFTSTGQEDHLRVHNVSGSGAIEFRYATASGAVSWNTLMNTTTNNTWDGTTLTFNFAEYWDNTELLSELLFVNGDSHVYMWTGAVATFASATATTITLQGTSTWAQLGFLTSTTGRGIVIGGTVYTYTGGHSTTTLTGVSPDPTGAGYAAGSVITQSVLAYANSSITNLPSSFGQDLIATMNNRFGMRQQNQGWCISQNRTTFRM